MRRNVFIAVALVIASNAFAARLENAQVVQHDGSRGFAAEVRKYASSSTPVWIAWDAPVADTDSQMCCFGSVEAGRKNQWRNGHCSLGGKRGNFFSSTSDNAVPMVRSFFSIFAHASNGSVDEIRMFSEDCGLDGEGMTVHYLTNVNPADGIA